MTHYKLYDSLCSGSFYFFVCNVNLEIQTQELLYRRSHKKCAKAIFTFLCFYLSMLSLLKHRFNDALSKNPL